MFINESVRLEKEREAQEKRATRNLRYAFIGLFGVIVIASVGLALIFAQNNSELLDEVRYIEAQVEYAATRYFALSPLDITLTPAVDFFATATAYAGFDNFDWQPEIETIGDVEMVLVPGGCFFMGSNEISDEQPIHELCIEEDFWID